MSKYKENTLSNGLKILLSEDHAYPIVTLSLIIKAGSRYESSSEFGYAHILEHMLLKGTKNFPTPVDVAKKVESRGGYRNASTGRDYMSFDFEIHSKYTEEILELLSEIIFQPLISPEILENEKKVIIEEFRKRQEVNQLYLYQKNFENIFDASLGHDIVGDENFIQSANSAALRNYKDIFFKPNRSALVISGDVKIELISKLAEKYFGQWSSDFSVDKYPEITPTDNKFSFYKKDLKQTFLVYSFYTFKKTNPREVIVLDLIRTFLNFGSASLLTQELRHKRGLIYNIKTTSVRFKDAGAFLIATSSSKPKETTEVLEGVFARLPELFLSDVFDDVKTQAIGGFERYISDRRNQVGFLSTEFILCDKLFTPEDYLEIMKSIEYLEVKEVINKYLTPDKMIVSALGPENNSK